MQYYGNGTKRGAQIPFNFGLLFVERNDIIATIDETVKLWLYNMPERMVANWVVSDFSVDTHIGLKTENIALSI